MNCQNFKVVATELARGQMMQADVRREALEHADGCDTCASRLHDENTLTLGFKVLADEMTSFEAPREIELKLREAFRSRPTPAIVAVGASPRKLYWLAAAAAAVLIVMASVAAVRLGGRNQQIQQANINQTPPVVVASKQDSPPQIQINQLAVEKSKPRPRVPRSVATNRVPRPRKSETPVVANHAREITTEFMPIGYMTVASLQDGGQIVRVELPRSALASFGLPVNMDRYNEKVKADVLLGVDGLAHAIRFVQ
jgi:hypothetical protein